MQNKNKKATLSKRVKKAHGAAGFAGVVYFLGNIALLALACLGLFGTESAKLWALNFYQPALDLLGGAGLTAELVSSIIASGLYALILVFGLINVIVSCTKLSWLGKKKASKVYGFNRPEYGMEDLGRSFSNTFHAVVFLGLVAYMFYGATAITTWGLLAVAGGLFVHFVAGFVGGSVSLFVIEDKVYEEKRLYGGFSVFLRNLFQIAAVAGISYALVQLGGIKDFTLMMLASGYADPMAMIYPICQVLVLVWLLFLSKHALNITEFDHDGPKAKGMKNFTVFSLITALTMAGGLVVEIFVRQTIALDATIIEAPQLWSVMIAAIGLVMFIIQLIMHKFPLVKASIKKEQAEAEAAAAAAALAAMPAPRPSVNFGFLNKPSVIKQAGHEYMMMPLEYDREYIPDHEELYDYDFCFEYDEEVDA